MAVPNKFKEVKKRDGRIVPFEQGRITEAVRKAMDAASEGDLPKDAERVSDRVVAELNKRYPAGHTPHIEEIQDIVEESLILMDFPKAAKAYILYRQKRAEVREKAATIPEHVKRLAAESKKYFRNALAEFIYYRTYSRWIEDEGRRETWIETIDRYMNFMKENLGDRLTEDEYQEIRFAILRQEVMPSMRLLWSAGKAARATNASSYNCSFTSPRKLEDFAEIMYLLMCGAGVGFSVESQNIQEFPIVKRQTGKVLAPHIIEDSKEGWGHALILGLKTWYRGLDIVFDFSKLRPAGARLKTMGGRSSGPEPLKSLLSFARAKILARQGKRLSNLDVHDIICKIGEIVVAGGVRRSALISLSDLDDEEMRRAKTGHFYVTEPHRQMANNSTVYNEKPPANQFLEEWLALAKSGTGERGIFNRGSLRYQLPARRWKVFEKHWPTCGTNPCITGDTLVYVADGRGNMPIKQLAEEGKDVAVFCLDRNGKIAIRYMRHPRLTGIKSPVYKVILDDGSTIKATGNHKFLLKSGEYREVKNLAPGDSLSIATRFEASIKDLFPKANANSQDYWWINNGRAANIAEHRSMAEFYCNTRIPRGYVVHHRDRNAQNNNPANLEIMSRTEHDALHGELMSGDNNPMRRAHKEWDAKKWHTYRLKHSRNNAGAHNKNFSGVQDEELKRHALQLTKILGRRFSHKNWMNYAKQHHLPQHFSKWRRDHLGGIMGLAKWAAAEIGFDHIDADPRVVVSYKKYTSQGYNCIIASGCLLIIKRCEVCGREFRTKPFRREYGMCSISCSLKWKWQDKSHRSKVMRLIHAAHAERKQMTREAQAKTFLDLKFLLRRDPRKKEWVSFCQQNGISPEISRKSSPFRAYDNLKEYASQYNHKVAKVEVCGYEDVYNGTVDEFHNFFVGGFESSTRNGKRKFVYLNNPQCGEIILRSKQFCNLSEVVARSEDTEETLLKKIRLATILGTYQSTLTNFPYLSRKWKENCEEERLLGVSITGLWDSPVARNFDTLRALRDYAIEVNREYAKRFGINESTCVSCIKPSGTVSQLVDASSGMHPRHAKFYIRRVRISATDPLFHMLKEQKFPHHPEVGQLESSATTFVLDFPVASPKGAVFRNDLTAIDQLEHWKMLKQNYTEHNPSVTISVGDTEWIEVANWLYQNWDMLGGLSFLPREEHVYQLAPYEEITEDEYRKLTDAIPDIDFSNIVAYEKEDATIGSKELACVGNVCEVDLSDIAAPAP